MAQAAPAEQTGAPRFIHLIPTALGRGSQVFARTLVDELGGARSGHRLVSLFGSHTDVPVDDALRLPGKDASGLHARALGRLRRHLRAVRPDVVVAHGGDALKYAALVTGVPIVYCVIGTWPADRRRRAQRLLWRALAGRARVAAAVSDDVAADCEAVLGLDRRRLVVIPNGRDAARYRPRTAEPSPSDADQGQRAHLAFVGHLDAGKRPDMFIALVAALRGRGRAVSASITGDGPLRADLEAPARAAGVELAGWNADVVPHLQRADVFVFPSAPDGEGMPGVLIEAGLCGVPVVATRVAGASTVVDEGVTGLLVPVDDPDALLDAVDGLVHDPGRRAAMGVAARARCESAFALPEVARRWDALLQSVLGRGPDAAAPVPDPPAMRTA